MQAVNSPRGCKSKEKPVLKQINGHKVSTRFAVSDQCRIKGDAKSMNKLTVQMADGPRGCKSKE